MDHVQKKKDEKKKKLIQENERRAWINGVGRICAQEAMKQHEVLQPWGRVAGHRA
jgi:hypothetical protein